LPAGADSDADGLADAWELSLFGSTNTLAGADPDGDGASNLSEFIAGTSPTNGASNLRLTSSLAQGQVRIEFQTIVAAGAGYEGKARHYALESSPTLDAAGQPVADWSDILADGTPKTFTTIPQHGSSFYRLRVWLK
jgi:hypothetical protein